MNNVRKYLITAALLGLAVSAQARRNELSHEPVTVAKGETLRKDVATDKSIKVDGVLDGDAVSVGGTSVTVNNEVTGDVLAVGGALNVPGVVRGDAVSIGGPVSVSGKVEGDLVSIGGPVSLLGSAVVEGDIVTMGGGLTKSAKSMHHGEAVSFDIGRLRKVLPKVIRMSHGAGHWDPNRDYSWRDFRDLDGGHGGKLSPWLVGGLIGAGLAIFFSIVVTGLVLMLLPAVFFPKQAETVHAAITCDMWRAGGIGALIVIGFIPGLLIMVVSLLGIPLVPFALIAFAAAWALGLSAFCVALQDRFFAGIGKPGPAGLVGKAAAGWALMGGLFFFGKMIPFLGGLLSLLGFMLMAVGSVIGLGAVYMTRMGSRTHQRPPASPAQPPQGGQPAAQ